MTLWSPPRISKSALVATRAAFAPLANGLGSAARGAAARRAIHGLRAGRVTPGQVELALASGEGGLLALLANCAALPQAPTVEGKALASVTTRSLLSRPTIEALLVWCRALLSEGYVSVEELDSLNASRNAPDILRLVVTGWNRMVDAVVDGMGLSPPVSARCAYTLAPASVLRAMEEASGQVYGIDQLFDEGKDCDGVVTITDAWPCVDLMADPATDPAFYGALCHAWDSAASKCGLLVSSGDTDGYLGGMLTEALHDLGRTATWDGDVPHFETEAMEWAIEEIGWFAPEEFPDVAATFLRHAKHDRAARAMDTRAMDSALAGDAERTALVARLRGIADSLPARPRRSTRSRARSQTFYSTEGQEHFCALLPRHAGLASMYEAQLQEASSESAVFFAAHDAQDPAQLLAVAKEGIMQVAAASAALSYVQEYNDATSSR
ncbi:MULTISPECIES: hypothetical protein [unclassified Rhodanobacter]|uniref:hypothetical protein n=1 Tax=unclassified Rhodanobacter TaxID=2621553 RepID=UPI0007A9EF9B|nr:hypothetical protein [Rhodanobacter sp. FW510-R10]KZC32587.1 hypothetical protein RhoFW510R10_11775 [Rhodanobacter sp. FW510-R10]